MTAETFELSPYNGRPVELYEFRYGDGETDIIRMTNADQLITVGADEYTPVPVSWDGFTDEGNPDDESGISLTMPRINELADLYRIQPPEKIVTLKIRWMHRHDPDAQVLTRWSGRVVGVSWEGASECRVSCERISTSLKRTGLRARYQRQCRHVHYGTGCGLLRAAYQVTGNILSITEQTTVQLTEAATFDDGYFIGGILEFQGTMRLVISHVGDALVINRAIVGLAVDEEISIYPGCDRSAATCSAKFDNVENYGGFDFIPGKGPFDGSSLV